LGDRSSGLEDEKQGGSLSSIQEGESESDMNPKKSLLKEKQREEEKGSV